MNMMIMSKTTFPSPLFLPLSLPPLLLLLLLLLTATVIVVPQLSQAAVCSFEATDSTGSTTVHIPDSTTGTSCDSYVVQPAASLADKRRARLLHVIVSASVSVPVSIQGPIAFLFDGTRGDVWTTDPSEQTVLANTSNDFLYLFSPIHVEQGFSGDLTVERCRYESTAVSEWFFPFFISAPGFYGGSITVADNEYHTKSELPCLVGVAGGQNFRTFTQSWLRVDLRSDATSSTPTTRRLTVRGNTVSIIYTKMCIDIWSARDMTWRRKESMRTQHIGFVTVTSRRGDDSFSKLVARVEGNTVAFSLSNWWMSQPASETDPRYQRLDWQSRRGKAVEFLFVAGAVITTFDYKGSSVVCTNNKFTFDFYNMSSVDVIALNVSAWLTAPLGSAAAAAAAATDVEFSDNTVLVRTPTPSPPPPKPLSETGAICVIEASAFRVQTFRRYANKFPFTIYSSLGDVVFRRNQVTTQIVCGISWLVQQGIFYSSCTADGMRVSPVSPDRHAVNNFMDQFPGVFLPGGFDFNTRSLRAEDNTVSIDIKNYIISRRLREKSVSQGDQGRVTMALMQFAPAATVFHARGGSVLVRGNTMRTDLEAGFARAEIVQFHIDFDDNSSYAADQPNGVFHGDFEISENSFIARTHGQWVRMSIIHMESPQRLFFKRRFALVKNRVENDCWAYAGDASCSGFIAAHDGFINHDFRKKIVGDDLAHMLRKRPPSGAEILSTAKEIDPDAIFSLELIENSIIGRCRSKLFGMSYANLFLMPPTIYLSVAASAVTVLGNVFRQTVAAPGPFYLGGWLSPGIVVVRALRFVNNEISFVSELMGTSMSFTPGEEMQKQKNWNSLPWPVKQAFAGKTISIVMAESAGAARVNGLRCFGLIVREDKAGGEQQVPPLDYPADLTQRQRQQSQRGVFFFNNKVSLSGKLRSMYVKAEGAEEFLGNPLVAAKLPPGLGDFPVTSPTSSSVIVFFVKSYIIADCGAGAIFVQQNSASVDVTAVTTPVQDSKGRGSVVGNEPTIVGGIFGCDVTTNEQSRFADDLILRDNVVAVNVILQNSDGGAVGSGASSAQVRAHIAAVFPDPGVAVDDDGKPIPFEFLGSGSCGAASSKAAAALLISNCTARVAAGGQSTLLDFCRAIPVSDPDSKHSETVSQGLGGLPLDYLADTLKRLALNARALDCQEVAGPDAENEFIRLSRLTFRGRATVSKSFSLAPHAALTPAQQREMAGVAPPFVTAIMNVGEKCMSPSAKILLANITNITTRSLFGPPTLNATGTTAMAGQQQQQRTRIDSRGAEWLLRCVDIADDKTMFLEPVCSDRHKVGRCSFRPCGGTLSATMTKEMTNTLSEFPDCDPGVTLLPSPRTVRRASGRVLSSGRAVTLEYELQSPRLKEFPKTQLASQSASWSFGAKISKLVFFDAERLPAEDASRSSSNKNQSMGASAARAAEAAQWLVESGAVRGGADDGVNVSMVSADRTGVLRFTVTVRAGGYDAFSREMGLIVCMDTQQALACRMNEKDDVEAEDENVGSDKNSTAASASTAPAAPLTLSPAQLQREAKRHQICAVPLLFPKRFNNIPGQAAARGLSAFGAVVSPIAIAPLVGRAASLATAVALSRQRFILDSADCHRDVDSPLSFLEHPLGFALGSRRGKYLRGAALGNFIVLFVVLVAAVLYAVYTAQQLRTRGVKNLHEATRQRIRRDVRAGTFRFVAEHEAHPFELEEMEPRRQRRKQQQQQRQRDGDDDDDDGDDAGFGDVGDDSDEVRQRYRQRRAEANELKNIAFWHPKVLAKTHQPSRPFIFVVLLLSGCGLAVFGIFGRVENATDVVLALVGLSLPLFCLGWICVVLFPAVKLERCVTAKLKWRDESSWAALDGKRMLMEAWNSLIYEVTQWKSRKEDALPEMLVLASEMKRSRSSNKSGKTAASAGKKNSGRPAAAAAAAAAKKTTRPVPHEYVVERFGDAFAVTMHLRYYWFVLFHDVALTVVFSLLASIFPEPSSPGCSALQILTAFLIAGCLLLAALQPLSSRLENWFLILVSVLNVLSLLLVLVSAYAGGDGDSGGAYAAAEVVGVVVMWLCFAKFLLDVVIFGSEIRGAAGRKSWIAKAVRKYWPWFMAERNKTNQNKSYEHEQIEEAAAPMRERSGQRENVVDRKAAESTRSKKFSLSAAAVAVSRSTSTGAGGVHISEILMKPLPKKAESPQQQRRERPVSAAAAAPAAATEVASLRPVARHRQYQEQPQQQQRAGSSKGTKRRSRQHNFDLL